MRTLRKGAPDFGEMRSKRSAGSSPYTRGSELKTGTTAFCSFLRRRTFPRSSARSEIIGLLSIAEREVLADCSGPRSTFCTNLGSATTGIYIELCTGTYSPWRNYFPFCSLQPVDTPLMRGRYPPYAWKTARDTPVMRKPVPRLCVANSRFSEGDRTLPRHAVVIAQHRSADATLQMMLQ
jgi:hypothetical protein